MLVYVCKTLVILNVLCKILKYTGINKYEYICVFSFFSINLFIVEVIYQAFIWFHHFQMGGIDISLYNHYKCYNFGFLSVDWTEIHQLEHINLFLVST